MRIDQEYHHFKGSHLSRAERIEALVVNELVRTHLPDDLRESSQAWELMHSSTCKAFMHVLAEKRGLPVELARVAGAVHDYYVIRTGKYKDHARLGAPMVATVLQEEGTFSDKEITMILEMVEHHSDKHIYSDRPHVELIKDVDVFDCSLYEGTEFYYLTRKPLPVCREYFRRILRVRTELGMPQLESYKCLEVDGTSRMTVRNDVAAGMDPNYGPTALMVSLWALAVSEAARTWPCIMMFNDCGNLTWLGSGSWSVSDMKPPSWLDVRNSFAEARSRLCKVEGLGQTGRVRDLLNTARESITPLWIGVNDWRRARKEAAQRFQDYQCDPEGDSIFQDMIRACQKDKLSEFGDILAEVSCLDDSAACLNRRWDLSERQRDALDEIARVDALARLRAFVVKRIHHVCEAASSSAGWDLAWQFPSKLFGCEEVPGVRGPEDVWLCVAWPRFKRFEYLVGEGARDRFHSLKSYYEKA